MGLDTTIYHTSGKPQDEPKEVAYWRKNWSITEFIINKFGHEGDNNCREILLNAEAIQETITFLEGADVIEYHHYYTPSGDVKTFKKLYNILESEGGLLIFYAWW